jgi:hypothetical protein
MIIARGRESGRGGSFIVGIRLRLTIRRIYCFVVLRNLDRPLGRAAADGSHVDDGI